MQPSLRRLCAVLMAVLSGCGLLFGKHKSTAYVTPEGYHGATAQKGPYVLDAVYMDDSTRGIEGVVRLTWWTVFSVTVQNRSHSEVSIADSAFSLVHQGGQAEKALSLDKVLGYESHVVGPLMSYQRRAIRRAFWTSDPIAPGAFAVGYIFFPREASLSSCSLVLDPNPYKRKDELVAVFSFVPPAAPAPVVAAPAETTVTKPAAADTTGLLREAVEPKPAPTAPAEPPSSTGPDTAAVPAKAPASAEETQPATTQGSAEQPAPESSAPKAAPSGDTAPSSAE